MSYPQGRTHRLEVPVTGSVTERGHLWEGPMWRVRWQGEAGKPGPRMTRTGQGVRVIHNRDMQSTQIVVGAGAGSRAREGGTVAIGWIRGKLGLCSAWCLGGGRVPFSGERRKREAAG